MDEYCTNVVSDEYYLKRRVKKDCTYFLRRLNIITSNDAGY